jgi:hypothetical protein
MKLRFFLVPAVCVSVLVFSAGSTRSQTVVTFDDLHETGTGTWVANGYRGLDWDNFIANNAILFTNIAPYFFDYYLTNGLSGNYYGIMSASTVAISGGATGAAISSTTNFNFQSVYLTGMFNSNMNIEVEGFRSGALLYDTTVVASATAPTLFTFNYMDVDQVAFNPTGGEPAFGTPSWPEIVMDNLTFEFVPEPSSLLLTSLGVVTLWAYAKRKRT